jgi:hypothetical protein
VATYKVIQDIEAEDKLVAWLSFRQFVYAGIVAVCGVIGYQLARVQIWLIIPLLPPIIFFGLLASPLGKDQPTEVWLLAKIRFFLKPRRRIWDQSGVKQLVTVTAPKKIERHLTDNLSQSEVKSRLQALADTIDSRGWAIKNVNVNMFATPAFATEAGSDRLLNASNIPQEVSNLNITSSDDMMDETSNPRAQQLSQMISASSQAHRKQIMTMMQQGGVTTPPAAATTTGASAPATTPDYWFLSNSVGQQSNTPPGYTTFGADPFVTPNGTTTNQAPAAQTPTDPTGLDEEALLKHIREEKARPNPMHSKLKTILPLEEQQQIEEQQRREAEARAALDAQLNEQKAAVTPQADPAILDLANNDDLNVATIAREADKRRERLLEGDEVVISLH